MATDAIQSDPITSDSIAALAAELRPNIDHLITEDDEPADSIFSEKQQRLLTESLNASWGGPGPGRPFVAMSNVGLFNSTHRQAIVPDVLLSIDVKLPADAHAKYGKSYFTWEFGRLPDVVIEVVSNREGGEDSVKLARYAEIGVHHYAIFDPDRFLNDDVLQVFRLNGYTYERISEPFWFPEVNLGLQLWPGQYENLEATWLRWLGADGHLIPTGKEGVEVERQRAEAERQRADEEWQRAESAEQRAENAEQRAKRLAEKLRQLGVDSNGE